MTTTVPNITITLAEAPQRIALNALYAKSADTDHYLRGYRDNRTPGLLDTCCDAHRALFDEDKAQRDVLVGRKRQTRALIDLIEGADPAATTPTILSAQSVTLVYRDENDIVHRRGLTDVVAAGTRIDLESAAAVVDFPTDRPGSRDNRIAHELADALRDREDDESLKAAEWLGEHKSDVEIWNLVGGLLDQLTRLALDGAGASSA